MRLASRNLVLVLSAASLTLFAAAAPAQTPAPAPDGPRVQVVNQGPNGFTLDLRIPEPVRTPVDLRRGGASSG